MTFSISAETNKPEKIINLCNVKPSQVMFEIRCLMLKNDIKQILIRVED